MLLGAAFSAQAFSPVVTEITQPYEIITLDNEPEIQQQYLGDLQNYPVMYEITSEEDFALRVNISQYTGGDELTPFSLIAIRKNDRGGGVTEVGRLRFNADSWTSQRDSVLGMTMWSSADFVQAVGPGTYRIEISTPENQGKYLISFGSGDSAGGYFASLAGVRTTHQFYGYSIIKMLASSLVYYPLGILLLLFIMHRTWKYRALITKNVD